jgi:hypothetical protein
MSENLRYYNVTAEVRDASTTGVARMGVIAHTRDEAVSMTRRHARATSLTGRRVTKVISARLSERFKQKEART